MRSQRHQALSLLPPNQDGNGMWYSQNWTEADWLRGWSLVAKRYASNRAVVGAGLRNEPRPTIVGEAPVPPNGVESESLFAAGCAAATRAASAAHVLTSFVPASFSQPHLTHPDSTTRQTPGGRLRIPTWGAGGAATDIAPAYEKAASAVLAARPTYLVFAQALLAGRDLRAAKLRPLTLRTCWPAGRVVEGQLAYEVHEYPYLWGAVDFGNYTAYRERLDDAWGYMAASNKTPVWLGGWLGRRAGGWVVEGSMGCWFLLRPDFVLQERDRHTRLLQESYELRCETWAPRTAWPYCRRRGVWDVAQPRGDHLALVEGAAQVRGDRRSR